MFGGIVGFVAWAQFDAQFLTWDPHNLRHTISLAPIEHCPEGIGLGFEQVRLP